MLSTSTTKTAYKLYQFLLSNSANISDLTNAISQYRQGTLSYINFKKKFFLFKKYGHSFSSKNSLDANLRRIYQLLNQTHMQLTPKQKSDISDIDHAYKNKKSPQAKKTIKKLMEFQTYKNMNFQLSKHQYIHDYVFFETILKNIAFLTKPDKIAIESIKKVSNSLLCYFSSQKGYPISLLSEGISRLIEYLENSKSFQSVEHDNTLLQVFLEFTESSYPVIISTKRVQAYQIKIALENLLHSISLQEKSIGGTFYSEYGEDIEEIEDIDLHSMSLTKIIFSFFDNKKIKNKKFRVKKA